MRHYDNEAPNLAEELDPERVDPGWRNHAACRAKDPETFFPRAGENANRISEFCRTRCPVIDECRAEFDRIEGSHCRQHLHGVVGGETVEQRIARRRSTGANLRAATPCPWPGQTRAVSRHLARGEELCLKCSIRARRDEVRETSVIEAVDLAIRRGRSDHQIRLNMGISGAVVAARRELVQPELLPAPEGPCIDAGNAKGWMGHRMRGEQNCSLCEEKMASRRRGGRKRAECGKCPPREGAR